MLVLWSIFKLLGLAVNLRPTYLGSLGSLVSPSNSPLLSDWSLGLLVPVVIFSVSMTLLTFFSGLEGLPQSSPKSTFYK